MSWIGILVAILLFAACDAADTITDNVTDAVDVVTEEVKETTETLGNAGEAFVNEFDSPAKP